MNRIIESIKLLPEMNDFDKIRFWSSVKKINNEQCWIWLSAKVSQGYGQFKVKNKVYKAHRIAYYFHYNIDPLDELVLHKCNNPSCCNPFHLYTGNHQTNNEQKFEDYRDNTPQGVECYQALFNEEQILQIRSSILSDYDLAKIFKCNRSTISYIRTRKHYKNI